ncbi:hypothetical protein BASA81_018379 [Batrachochytrium salamandrivorans]|nr:hypothetical protein BASA81_018379 [Batrachochytrium salamandrivorans]
MGDEEDGTDVKRMMKLTILYSTQGQDAPGSDRVKRRRLILDHLAPDRMVVLAHSQDSDHLMRRKVICMRDWQLVRKKFDSFVSWAIDQLKSENLWSFKQMKPHKPVSQPRTHRDYLLDEMKCVYMDFRQERKWKLATAAYTMAQWMLEWHQAIDKSTLCVKRRFTSESSMMESLATSPQHIASLAVEGRIRWKSWLTSWTVLAI